MHRTSITSEALRSVGYDPDLRVLEIEFVSGVVYRYLDVPEDLHLGLMAADSPGEFFGAHLREAGFEYRRID